MITSRGAGGGADLLKLERFAGLRLQAAGLSVSDDATRYSDARTEARRSRTASPS